MATRVFRVCDVCEDVTAPEDAETLSFTWEGRIYRLDLCETHRAEIVGALDRVATLAASLEPGPPATPTEAPVDPKAVRAWAASHKLPVPKTGRLPDALIAQYRAAGN